MSYQIPEEAQRKLAYQFHLIREELGLPDRPERDWKDAERWIIDNHYMHWIHAFDEYRKKRE